MKCCSDFTFDGFTGLELGVGDRRLADEPLVLLLLEEGVAKRFPDHFAGVVVEAGGEFFFHGAFQFRRDRDVQECNLQRSAIFVKVGGSIGRLDLLNTILAIHHNSGSICCKASAS